MCEIDVDIGWVEESPGMFVLRPNAEQAERLWRRQLELRDSIRRLLAAAGTQESIQVDTET